MRDDEALRALEVLARKLGQSASGPTVESLWKDWADVYRHRLSDFATELGRSKPLLRFFGHREAETLTVADIDGELGYRARRKSVGPATRNREVTLLKRWLNYAVQEGKIRLNPIAHAPMEPEPPRLSKIETPEKLEALLDEATALTTVLCLLLYETGMRRKEAFRVRWDQITPDGQVIIKRTKNRTPRRVRLGPASLDALSALPHICEHVFANPKTKRAYCMRHLDRMLERTIVASGLTGIDGEKVTPHMFRHGFAYRLRRRLKIPEKVIMKMGGWKTRSAFDRYGIVDEEETEEGWERVVTQSTSQNLVDRKGPLRAKLDTSDDEIPSGDTRAEVGR